MSVAGKEEEEEEETTNLFFIVVTVTVAVDIDGSRSVSCFSSNVAVTLSRLLTLVLFFILMSSPLKHLFHFLVRSGFLLFVLLLVTERSADVTLSRQVASSSLSLLDSWSQKSRGGGHDCSRREQASDE